jgi:hypothetical protein
MGTYRREGDSFDQDHNHPERVTEWQDLSRSGKSFAFSFLAVVVGVVALAAFGFASLIHRLLF